MGIKIAIKQGVIIIACFCLVACTTYHSSAPVTDINVHRVGKVMVHRVQTGETLYSVAWRYELDYRTLARINGLKPPYTISLGQNLKLSGPPVKSSVVAAKSVTPQPVHKPVVVAPEPTGPIHQWIWPARGSIYRAFSSNNKGIDIAGVYNEPILAAAKGKVVYEGDGIRGYGNLIIIKHNEQYLTAYAHISRVFVKEGVWVKAGQKIGQMGINTSGRVVLHFELRRQGKPINPRSVIRDS